MQSATDQRLDTVQRELHRYQQAMRRGSWLTAAVGALALALLGGYFWYGYQRVKEALEPPTLIGFAENLLDDQIPQARMALEKQIQDSSTDWARRLSKEAQDAIPTARKRLEDHVMAEFDKVLAQSVVMSEEQFRSFLRENRPALEKGLREMSDGPTMAENTLADLEAGMGAQLGANMQHESTKLLASLMALNEKLDTLSRNEKLTPEQQLERRILMLARRLQSDKVRPAVADASKGTSASQ